MLFPLLITPPHPPACSYVPLNGFSAAAPFSAGADCWQQLAVVKSGPTLTWYYNKDLAGGPRRRGASACGDTGQTGTRAAGPGRSQQRRQLRASSAPLRFAAPTYRSSNPLHHPPACPPPS